MAEESRVKGCFKWGCLGCLGLFALAILVTGGMTAIALLQDRTPRVEEHEMAQEIPPFRGIPGPPEDVGDPMSDVVQGFRLDGYAVAEPGRVLLDLSIGEFEIVPGPADEPAHVEAVYDTTRYRLDQSWETWGENGWTYRVTFGTKSIFRMLTGMEGRPPKLRIVLPRDRPFVLEAEMSMGQSRTELGGLWVLDARLDYGTGEHTLSFSEPLAAPLEGLLIEGSMGEIRVQRAGNASPARLEASHSMGALNVDLRGRWVRDGVVEVGGSMGEFSVRLPEEWVAIDLERASVALGEADTRALRDRPDPPPGAPKLTIRARGSLGELRLYD